MSSPAQAPPSFALFVGRPLRIDLLEDEEVVRQAEGRDRRPEAPRRRLLVSVSVSAKGATSSCESLSTSWYVVQDS